MGSTSTIAQRGRARHRRAFEHGNPDATNDVSGARAQPVDVFDIEIGGEKLVVLSFPIEPTVELDELTPAEREVARAVVRGLSNEEVARSRGCSPRTVACQLASIYRKLGVSSRTELAVRLNGERH